MFGVSSIGAGTTASVSAVTETSAVQEAAVEHARIERVKAAKRPVSEGAGRAFFAGRGRSMQPEDWEHALALARGLRRSSRFAGYLYDPNDPKQKKLEDDYAEKYGYSKYNYLREGDESDLRPRTLMTASRRRSKLSAGGVTLERPGHRLGVSNPPDASGGPSKQYRLG